MCFSKNKKKIIEKLYDKFAQDFTEKCIAKWRKTAERKMTVLLVKLALGEFPATMVLEFKNWNFQEKDDYRLD